MPHTAPLPNTRSGFSLVELSVALAVIGLLMGGILGFQSYLRNATLTNMMNESKLLISAFQQFQTRYNNPPGDFSTASSLWTGAGNGDGNGLIRAATVAVPLERYYAFQHLALGGFIQGRYTGAVNGSGGATIGENVQGSSMDNVAFIFDHPDATDGVVSSDALYFDGHYGNILRVAGLNGSATDIPNQPFIDGAQALALDLKYDDGIPSTGNMVTPKTSALTGCTSDATTYATASEAKTCYFFIRVQ